MVIPPATEPCKRVWSCDLHATRGGSGGGSMSMLADVQRVPMFKSIIGIHAKHTHHWSHNQIRYGTVSEQRNSECCLLYKITGGTSHGATRYIIRSKTGGDSTKTKTKWTLL